MSQELKCIHDGAREGDTLVLDHVSFNTDQRAAMFAQPAFFVVIEVVRKDTNDYSYILRHIANGEVVEFGSRICRYLSMVHDWWKWKESVHSERINGIKAELATTEIRYNTVRGILLDQGVRVITPQQAKTIGLLTEGS